MIRGAWSDSYLRTQEMIGLKEGQGISAADAADFKSYEARLQEQIGNYRGTVTTDEDKVEFAAFEKYNENYHNSLAAVLDLHQRNEEAQAIKLFNEQLTPAWTAGRMKLNDILRENKAVAATGHRSY